jgi:hypothetical protein
MPKANTGRNGRAVRGFLHYQVLFYTAILPAHDAVNGSGSSRKYDIDLGERTLAARRSRDR